MPCLMRARVFYTVCWLMPFLMRARAFYTALADLFHSYWLGLFHFYWLTCSSSLLLKHRAFTAVLVEFLCCWFLKQSVFLCGGGTGPVEYAPLFSSWFVIGSCRDLLKTHTHTHTHTHKTQTHTHTHTKHTHTHTHTHTGIYIYIYIYITTNQN